MSRSYTVRIDRTMTLKTKQRNYILIELVYKIKDIRLRNYRPRNDWDIPSQRGSQSVKDLYNLLIIWKFYVFVGWVTSMEVCGEKSNNNK